MVRLPTVLNSWKTVREDTALAVEDFPAAELDFRPVPELASFREIARHILDASHGLTGLLLEGVDNFATPQFREMLNRHVSKLPEDIGASGWEAELRQSQDPAC